MWLFILSFYCEIIIYFPKAIYSSHQEEQLKKNVFPVLPKLWWKWFKLWISLASVQMAFTIWMSNSSNRKHFPSQISLTQVVIEHGCPYHHHHHSFTNKLRLHKTVTETRLLPAVISPTICISAPQLHNDSGPPPTARNLNPSIFNQDHRMQAQISLTNKKKRGPPPWHDVHIIGSKNCTHMCTTLKVARFSKWKSSSSIHSIRSSPKVA